MFRRSVYVVTWFNRAEGFLGGVSVFKSKKAAMNLYTHLLENSPHVIPRFNRQPFADPSWR